MKNPHSIEEMARPARLELATLCLEGRRSIQLSYGRILATDSMYCAYCAHRKSFGSVLF